MNSSLQARKFCRKRCRFLCEASSDVFSKQRTKYRPGASHVHRRHQWIGCVDAVKGRACWAAARRARPAAPPTARPPPASPPTPPHLLSASSPGKRDWFADSTSGTASAQRSMFTMHTRSCSSRAPSQGLGGACRIPVGRMPVQHQPDTSGASRSCTDTLAAALTRSIDQ